MPHSADDRQICLSASVQASRVRGMQVGKGQTDQGRLKPQAPLSPDAKLIPSRPGSAKKCLFPEGGLVPACRRPLSCLCVQLTPSPFRAPAPLTWRSVFTQSWTASAAASSYHLCHMQGRGSQQRHCLPVGPGRRVVMATGTAPGLRLRWACHVLVGAHSQTTPGECRSQDGPHVDAVRQKSRRLIIEASDQPCRVQVTRWAQADTV